MVATLNRPAQLNAIDFALRDALFDLLADVEAAFPEVRVLILTGEGAGFCSGADVSMIDRPASGERAPAAAPRRVVDLAAQLSLIPQPVVAAINGVAAGAGLALALASDVRIGSIDSRYSSIFVKRALVPDCGTTVTLPAVVGSGVAAEMALTGRIYDAPWALRVGLISEITPPDELMQRAHEVADEIAANPPLAVRATKELMGLSEPAIAAAVAREVAANARGAGSSDRVEAISAFVDKRAAVFHGR